MPKQQIITKSALVPTVLISGGAGFIGSHLAEHLLQNKARVIVLDNFKTGKDIHVKHLLSDTNFALYDVDINEGIPQEIQSVDYVFHLAGLEEYFYSKEYLSLESLFTNSLGTKNLLDLAKRSSAKFLLASTIDVYQGRISQLGLNKYFGSSGSEENKFSLLEAKRFAEAVVWEYHKKHNVDVRIVRLPEVYGPRMDLSSSGFLGGYIKNVLDGSSIEIFGDGVEKEFYLYISDAVSGIIKAQFNDNTKGNIYSLIPQSPVSALESAYLVRGVADAKLSVQFKKGLTDYASELKIPDTLNVKDLSWKPKVSLKDGVMKTLESFNYSPNTYAFKPAKLVEQKIKSQESLNDSIVSLQGVKITPKPKDTNPSEVFSSELDVLRVKKEPKKLLSLLRRRAEKKTKSNLDIKNEVVRYRYRIKADMGYGMAVVAIFLSALLVFVGVPSVSAYFNIKRGLKSIDDARTSITKMDSVKFESDTLSAYNAFKNGRSSLRRLKWVFSLAGKEKNYQSYDKLLGSLVLISKAGNTGSGALKPFERIIESIRPDSSSTLDSGVFDQAKVSVSGARDFIAMSEADLSSVDESVFPEKVRGRISDFKNILKDSNEVMGSLSTVMSGLPDVLGLNGEKKYIIWLQNSNELRPTGGFIGSYAVMDIQSGKITNLTIDDIYNPDGQIDVRNIQTSPPEPIKEYLKEEVLYLRNSNWDPDFTKSAKTFDDIYFKITGETVDGYIAVDLDFVESLLRITGPIFLASYNEDISAENIDERAQYYSGFDYKEGSTDKKSFLTILGGKLLESIFSLDKNDFPKVLDELDKSLSERHLQIYFSNNIINSLLKEKKWDGSLSEADKDYLFVVNSNLGGTKSNYYIETSMSYEVSSLTRDGLLRANLTLDYKNTAESDAWPGGPYTDYLRVLVQNGSKFTGAKIVYNDGKEEDISKDVVISSVGRYPSFETGFKLDPGDSLKVIFSYDLPEKMSLSKGLSGYSLLWQKQSGTSKDKYYFLFNPPFGALIENLSDGLSSDNGIVRSEGVLVKDLNYDIKIR